MEANELMIGDWFQTTYPNGKVEFRKVEGVMQNHIVCNNGVTNAIEPIPLTAEILEKNGWKWNRYNTSLELVVGTIHIGWGFYPNCISVSDWAENGDCQITSLRCEFVHELQHALRLCGLNDLADNFKVE